MYQVSRTRNIIIFASIGAAAFLIFAPAVSFASTNISASVTQHWAWNDFIGWLDFYNTNSITVSASGLTGYASSSAGLVSLDCHTSPIGNICGTSNYQVLNDGAGNLSGWGWNDTYGWVSFCGGKSTASCPGSINYQTYVNSSGNFQGWAWNDAVGWLTFNCDNPGICGTSNYEVATSWAPTSTQGTLDSTTFDTGVTSGAQLNSILWYGSLPAGTSIGFQFAVSNSSSGPWNYTGPDNTSGTSYTVAPSVAGALVPLSLNYSYYSGFRYFRYRTILTSDPTQTYTPRVDEIIVNWSP